MTKKEKDRLKDSLDPLSIEVNQLCEEFGLGPEIDDVSRPPMVSQRDIMEYWRRDNQVERVQAILKLVKAKRDLIERQITQSLNLNGGVEQGRFGAKYESYGHLTVSIEKESDDEK